MKKLLLAATFTVVGLTLISCEADAINESNNKVENVNASDLGNNSVDLSNANDGPGDDVIIIKPPKRP